MKNSENVVLRRLALERSVVAVRVDVLRSGMDECFFSERSDKRPERARGLRERV